MAGRPNWWSSIARVANAWKANQPERSIRHREQPACYQEIDMERRAFLSASAAALAGAILPRQTSGSSLASTVGIQLYTVRRLMSTDADGTLAALSGIGYREVELAGLYGRTASDFRKLLDKHGLQAPATHIS